MKIFLIGAVICVGSFCVVKVYNNFQKTQCQQKIDRVNEIATFRWNQCKFLHYPSGCLEAANTAFMADVAKLHYEGCIND